MAQPPAQEEPKNDPPLILMDTGAPDNPPAGTNGPSEQNSAPVDAILSSVNGHSNSEHKAGDIPAAIKAVPPEGPPEIANSSVPTESPTRSAGGLSDGGILTTVQPEPEGTPLPVSNCHSKQTSTQGQSRAATGCNGSFFCNCSECTLEGYNFGANQPSGAPPPVVNRSSEQGLVPVGHRILTGLAGVNPNTFGYGPAERVKMRFSKGTSLAETVGERAAADPNVPSTSTASSSEQFLPANQSQFPKGVSTRFGHRKAALKPRPPKPPPRTPKQEFFKILGDKQPGSKEFINLLRCHDDYFENPDFEYEVHANGNEYRLETLNKCHFFESSEGLGMEFPAGLTLKTVYKYVDLDTVIGITYSTNAIGHQLDNMMMRVFLRKFETPFEDRKEYINSIAYEFSDALLGKLFREPEFVRRNGIIQQLNTLLPNIPNRDSVADQSIEKMPKYTKFLIMSMAGSFTDTHFDFSGTSVFYHVLEGQKVFYIAPHSNENLANLNKFMYYQKKEPKSWKGSLMSNKWQRRVINAGQTAFIPGGHLHFVYTPVDSLVIGGNFILEKDMALSFKCTKHEEDLLEPYPENPSEKGDDLTRSHLFQGFRSTMWAYLEHMLLPRLRESRDAESIALGKIFVVGSREKWPLGLKEWYPAQKKADLIKELKRILNNEARTRGKKPTSMDGDEHELPGESEEASTSAASGSKRKQRATRKTMMKNDKEESLGDIEETGLQDDAAQEESFPSTVPKHRFIQPSTSTATNSRRKRNEKIESMDQEGEASSSQETSTSSFSNPTSISRRKVANLRTVVKEKNQPISADLSSETKESDPIEDKMEVDQPVAKEVLRRVEESSPPVSSSWDDDFDGGSRGQQTMDSDSDEQSIEVDGEEMNESLEGDKEVTKDSKSAEKSVEVVQNDQERMMGDLETTSSDKPAVPAFSYNTPANDRKKDVGSSSNSHPIPQEKRMDALKANANEQGKPSSFDSDSKTKDSETAEKPVEEIQNVREKMMGDQEDTSNYEISQPVAASESHRPTQQEAVDASKVPSIEENKLSSDVPEIKKPRPIEESLEKVQDVQEKIMENQESTPNNVIGHPVPASHAMETAPEPHRDTQLNVVDALKEPAIEENNLPSAIPEKKKPGPIKKSLEKVQDVQEEILEDEESTSSNEPTLPASSLNNISNTTTETLEPASDLLPTTPKDFIVASKVPENEEEKTSPVVSDFKKEEPKTNKEPMEQVREIQEKILDEKESTPVATVTPSGVPQNVPGDEPKKVAAASTTSSTLPSAFPTENQTHHQSMPTSSELLLRQKISGIDSDPARKEKDQVEKEEQPVNLSRADIEKEGEVADPANGMEDQAAQLEELASSSFFKSYQLINLTDSLPENVRCTAYLALASQMKLAQMVVRREAQGTSNEDVGGKKSGMGAVEVENNIGKTNSSRDAELRQTALYHHALIIDGITALPNAQQASLYHNLSRHMEVVKGLLAISQVGVEKEKAVTGPGNEAEEQAALEKLASSSFLQSFQLVNLINTLPMNQQCNAYTALALQMTAVEQTAHQIHQMAGTKTSHPRNEVGTLRSPRDDQPSADQRQTALYHHTRIIDGITALPNVHQPIVYKILSANMAVVRGLVEMLRAPTMESAPTMAASHPSASNAEEITQSRQKRAAVTDPSDEPAAKQKKH